MAPKAKPKGKPAAKAPEPVPKKAAPEPKAKAPEPVPKKAPPEVKAKAEAAPKAAAAKAKTAAGSGTAAVRQLNASTDDSQEKGGSSEEILEKKDEASKEGEDGNPEKKDEVSKSSEEEKAEKSDEASKEDGEDTTVAKKDAAEEIDAEEHARLEALQKQEMEKRAAEEELKRKERENGEVVLKYNMYAERFPIKDGKISAKEIDEMYCLSDVMPGCLIYLSEKSPEEKYTIECAEEVFPLVFEEPAGVFNGMEKENAYYVYVTQDPEELKKSQEKAKESWKGVKSEKVRGEGCSCLEGNPCMDEYICTDWHNRFALARKHGWIGYQAM